MNSFIKYLDLGNGFVIENDKAKYVLTENEDNAEDLDDAFADIIRMAEKIDEYYEKINSEQSSSDYR